ncbi:MAG: hypothetical protein AAGA16_22105 [Cyanobacteria bacterium P01_E01_bin.35]
MKIESIEQQLIEGTEMILTVRDAALQAACPITVLTRVKLNQVSSPCILSRLMMDTFGKPGIDNDLEFLGSGSQWEVVWTEPKLTIEKTREIINRALGLDGTL